MTKKISHIKDLAALARKTEVSGLIPDFGVGMHNKGAKANGF